MAEFMTVARTGEIPAGSARAYPINGRMVAVFHVDGDYHAILDSCPHMGASLASGYLDGHEVVCPWHAWRFCVRDGCWTDNPQASLNTDSFEVRVVDEEIQVLVPDPPPRIPEQST